MIRMHCIYEGCSVSVVEDFVFTYRYLIFKFFSLVAFAVEKFLTILFVNRYHVEKYRYYTC
jgi:hypothetical protein